VIELLALLALLFGIFTMMVLTGRVYLRARHRGLPCTKALVGAAEARLSLLGMACVVSSLSMLAVMAVLS
jgi:hypothetical protein